MAALDVPVRAYLDQELHKQLLQEAARSRRSQSDVLRMAFIEFLERRNSRQENESKKEINSNE